MNKLEMTETLRTEAGLTKTESAAAVSTFSDEMFETLIVSNLVEPVG